MLWKAHSEHRNLAHVGGESGPLELDMTKPLRGETEAERWAPTVVKLTRQELDAAEKQTKRKRYK